MPINRTSGKTPRLALFRVEFRGGAAVITKAANSIKAEQIARRQHPGLVSKVRLLKGFQP